MESQTESHDCILKWYLLLACLCIQQKSVSGAGTITSATATRRNYLDNHISVNSYRSLWQNQFQSAPLCLGNCSSDPRCAGIFYNVLTKQCQAHSVTMGSTVEKEEAPGSRYYTLPHGEHYIGDNCTHDTDCHTDNSECRNNTCWCTVGYSFYPELQMCTVCSQYGDLFMEVETGYISKFNMEDFQDTELEECFNLCLNRTSYECRTVEYKWTNGHCYLQNITKLDLADQGLFFFDWNYKFNISHFQRDCLS